MTAGRGPELVARLSLFLSEVRMKFSFAKFFAEIWKNGRKSKKTRALGARRVKLGLEYLEERLAPSGTQLPAPMVSNPGQLGGGYDPQVVVDPINPQIVAASWVSSPKNGKTSLVVAYSADGGQTWSGVGGLAGLADDPSIFNSVTNNTGTFTTTTSPSIAFDRSQQLYVVDIEENAGATSGMVILQRIDFSQTTNGNPPTVVALTPPSGASDLNDQDGNVDGATVLYRWLNQDPAYKPVVATDINLPSFTDPNTGAQQIDTMANGGTNVLGKITGGITSTSPSLTVTAATNAALTQLGITAPFVAQVDSEQMLITKVNGPTWTIGSHGDNNTIAASHNGNAEIGLPLSDAETGLADPKAVYVAWNTIFTQPVNSPLPTVSQVVVEGSADGGNSFSTLMRLSPNGIISESPQIIFNQGTSGANAGGNPTGNQVAVVGGQLTFFYSYAGQTTAAGTLPPAVTMNQSQPDGGSVTAPAVATEDFTDTGGPVSQASAPAAVTTTLNMPNPPFANGLAAGANTMIVTSSANFPTVPFDVTLNSGEDVKVIAESGVGNDTWTIQRAQNGTTAAQQNDGSSVVLIGQSNIANPTTFSQNVTFTAPNFQSQLTTINDLSVTINLAAPSMDTMALVLYPPSSSGLAPIALVQNRVSLLGAIINPAKPPGLPANADLGIMETGANPNINYNDDGTVFDQFAVRNITDTTAASPWVGQFQPEGGAFTEPGETQMATGALSEVDGMTPSQLSGTWTLIIVDTAVHNANNPPPEFLQDWSMHFSGAISTNHFGPNVRNTYASFGGNTFTNLATGISAAQTTIQVDSNAGFPPAPFTVLIGAEDLLVTNDNSTFWTVTRGADGTTPAAAAAGDQVTLAGAVPLTDSPTDTYGLVTPASGAQGIGPDFQVAYDNTLGSYSPYQDRIYLAYTSVGAGGSDTAVALASADYNGAWVWNPATQVNNDVVTDNFSEGNRPEFQPSLAVDPVTGTVAVSYYDGRNDPSGVRVANSIEVSNDGGATFSDNSYLNELTTATDFLSDNSVTVGPIPGNEPLAGASGFGDRQGLAIYGGNIFAVFASNLNGNGSDIFTAFANTAAGPRVIYGDQGPVTNVFNDPDGVIAYNNDFALNGTRQLDGFVVQFDRPILISSFTTADVQVQYQNPSTGAITSLNSIPDPVTITPEDPGDFGNGYGPQGVGEDDAIATEFYIEFAKPQSAAGTYSYAIGPDVSDSIETATALASSMLSTDSTLTVTTNIATGIAGPFVIQIDNEQMLVMGGNSANPMTWTILERNYNGAGAAAHSAGAQVAILGNLMDQNANSVTGEGVSFPTQVTTSIDMPTEGGLFIGDEVLNVLPTAALLTATLPFVIQIDSEQMLVTSAIDTVTADGFVTQLTVRRGFDGTTETDHLDGTPVNTVNAPDYYSNPTPVPVNGVSTVVGAPFQAPYQSSTLPLIIPGPYVVTTSIPTGPNHNYTAPVTTTDPGGILNTDTTMTVASDAGFPASTPFIVQVGLEQIQVSSYVAGSNNLIWNINRGFDATPIENDQPGCLVTYYPSNTVLNTTANAIDVTFDRQMNASSFTANDIISMTGPLGPIYGPFTVTANPAGTPAAMHNEVFRIGFPAQTLSGAYTIQVSPGSITDLSGDGVDTNLNAGLEVLRGAVANPATATITRQSFTDNTPVTIKAHGSVSATINVTQAFQILQQTSQYQFDGQTTFINQSGGLGSDPVNDITLNVNSSFGFPTSPSVANPFYIEIGTEEMEVTNVSGTTWTVIRGFNGTTVTSHADFAGITLGLPDTIEVGLSAAFPNLPNLSATLTSPKGTVVDLFTSPGSFGTFHANLSGVVLDDTSTAPIQAANASSLALGPGTFDPQTPLSQVNGQGSKGNWTLTITNNGASTGSLTNWDLVLPEAITNSGLGEAAADQFDASFNIFTQSPTNPQSSTQWTAVGPIGNTIGDTTTPNPMANVGPVTAIAVDNADPSGNTVYIGSNGGVWRTTNFLTSNPAGPTWAPLTDFGPANSLYISGLALVDQNNDPNQTVVFALTGRGPRTVTETQGFPQPQNTTQMVGDPGVGVLRSMDAGKTWEILDGMNNVDATGTILPIGSPFRDHTFDGMDGYQIVADPTPVPGGTVAGGDNPVYVAFSGAHGGIYRSLNDGSTWTLVEAGQATSVVLAASSRDANGNLSILYGAFAGDGQNTTPGGTIAGGVYVAAGDATTAVAMTQLVGNQISTPRVNDDGPSDGNFEIATEVPPETPNGPDTSNIELAVPSVTNDPLADTFYQGWLYATVSHPNGAFEALFVTKDGGDNWTQVALPYYVPDPAFLASFPTNDNLANASTPITGAIEIGNTVTITANNTFQIGESVTVEGMDQSVTQQNWGDNPADPFGGYNGTYIVTGVTRGPFGINTAFSYNDYVTGIPVEAGGIAIPSYTENSFDQNVNNYALTLTVDPQNPNIVYLGGNADDQYSGPLLRINIQTLSDPYTLLAHSNNSNDGGLSQGASVGDTNIYSGNYGIYDPLTGNVYNDYFNLMRDPNDPFVAPSSLQFTGVPDDQTLYLVNGAPTLENGFNNGAWDAPYAAVSQATDGNVSWMPFDNQLVGSANMLAVIAVPDPTTGGTRLVIGDDQGVYTGIDDGTGNLDTNEGSVTLPAGTRNGNLQIAELYDTASQPSTLAADLAGALFYATSFDNGVSSSSNTILETGNLAWAGDPNGGTVNGTVMNNGLPVSVSDVATDPTGSGLTYQFVYPSTLIPSNPTAPNPPFVPTDFFQITPVGSITTSRVSGLVQLVSPSGVEDQPGLNDGQWPEYLGSAFAVNQFDPTAIVMGSQEGQVFLTAGAHTGGTGVKWNLIATPGVLDGTYAEALAFGAPSSSGSNTPDNIVYAGTLGGNIFVTFNGGGTWTNISAGLDGSPVEQIVTSQQFGSHQAYAVTANGAYWMPDSTSATAMWVPLGILGATTLANPMLITDTQLIVNATAGFTTNVPFAILVGQEQMLVTSVNGTTWNVQRGYNNTTPAAYPAGQAVTESSLFQFTKTSTINSTAITNASGIIAGSNSMTVLSDNGFPAAPFDVLVGTELIKVTAVNGDTWTISRGINGTTAAMHAYDAPVYLQDESLGVQYLTSIQADWRYAITAGAKANIDTTLNGTVAAGTMSISVASITGFPATPFVIQIGTELMQVTHVNGTTWTVTPGFDGTTESQHPNGAIISLLTYPVLYVGADGGVFRSIDQGQTWAPYPNNVPGDPTGAGELPNDAISSLNLEIGDFNPQTGFYNTGAGGLNAIVASLNGRGDFMIRMDNSSLANYLVAPNQSGPAVMSVVGDVTNLGQDLAGVTVTFSGTVDPATFTTGQVTVTGPSGNSISIASVTDVSGTSFHNVYQIDFTTPQAKTGNYKITFGKITDLGGDPLQSVNNPFTYDFIADQPPTITAISSPQVVQPAGPSLMLNVTVGSAMFSASSLVLSDTFTPTTYSGSSQPTIALGVVGTSGATRSITISAPTGSFGAGTIMLTVMDSDGEQTSTSFTLDVDTPAGLTLGTIPNPFTVAHGAAIPAYQANGINNTTGDTLTYSASVTDPLGALEKKYGFTLQDGFFNLRGQDEKYLRSNNPAVNNPAGKGFYVLMPTGQIIPYDGVSLATTLKNGTPVATVSQAVYYNPALLVNNTGLPLVTTGTNPLYDLKIQLGLVNPVIAADTDARGDNEKYLLSSNGSNPVGSGYFVLMPNNMLYAYDGTGLATLQLVADFNVAPYYSGSGPITNVYANPADLYNAVLPTSALGVQANINSSTGALQMAVLPGFDRSVTVTVSVTDGVQKTPTTQTFPFTVTDAPPSASVNPQTVVHSNTLTPFNLNATTSASNTLSYVPTVTGYSPMYNLETQLGLTQPPIAADTNARHDGELYFQSTNGNNPAGSGFYVLMPTSNPTYSDQLFAYVPDAKKDLLSTLAGTPVANFGQAPYSTYLGGASVFANPALLDKAPFPALPNVAVNQGELYNIKEQYGLNTPDIAADFNVRKANEKYFLSTNGSNPAGSGYFVLLPDGLLYAWNGVSLPTTVATTPLADLSGLGVYANTALLYTAQPNPAQIADPIYNVKELYGLTLANVVANNNHRKQGEIYFQSTNGSNPAGGGYYVVVHDQLYAYVQDANNDLSATTNGPVLFDFTPYGNVDTNPALLYGDSGHLPAVAVGIDPAGEVTITQANNYVGTANINANVSDGAEFVNASFLFASTDGAPAFNVSPPANVTAVHGTAPAAVNVGATDPNPNDTLSYSVTVATDSPLYDVQAQFGLTQTIVASMTNQFSQNEKYFLSTNGSNAAGNNEFVLMPPTSAFPNELFAYVPGTGLTQTLAQQPVANLAPSGNVWGNPALLYNALPPGVAQVAVDRGELYNLRLTYGLTAPALPSAFNQFGFGEEYFKSSNGANPKNGGYFVLMPNGLLYAWDGLSIPTTISQPPIANLAPYGVYANTSLIANSAPVFVTSGVPINMLTPAVTISAPDASGNFTITPNAAFTGTLRIGVAVTDGLDITDETFLYSVADLAPTLSPETNAIVSGSEDLSNNVTITTATPNNYAMGEQVVIEGVSVGGYNGPAIVTSASGTTFTYVSGNSGLGAGTGGSTAALPPIASASEAGTTVTVVTSGPNGFQAGDEALISGAANSAYNGPVTITSVNPGSDSFTYTATATNLPAIGAGGTVAPLIQPLQVPGSSFPNGVSINLGGSAPDGGSLQYAPGPSAAPTYTTISANPLAGIQQQLDLSQTSVNAQYALLTSGNGNNPNHGFQYIVTNTNLLYAWQGNLAATLATQPLADFAPYANVYSNTALLTGATPTSIATVGASVSNTAGGGTLNLTWGLGFTGTFLVTVGVTDGALETQQQFLVTVM
jgi:hypothetical protein